MNIGIIGNGRFGNLVFNTLYLHTTCLVKVFEPGHKIDNRKFFSLEDVCNSDIVIPCVPISKFEEVIKLINPILKPSALLIEICSVKTYPVNIMLKNLNSNIEILATHPMFGPDSTDSGKHFKDLNFIYSKVRIINEQRLGQILKFLRSLGLNLIKMTPEEHDKQAAYTQAFAFLIGKIGIKLNVRANQITTKGFNGILYNQLSVENDTSTLFRDMQIYNPYSLEMRNKFLKALTEIEEGLKLN